MTGTVTAAVRIKMSAPAIPSASSVGWRARARTWVAALAVALLAALPARMSHAEVDEPAHQVAQPGQPGEHAEAGERGEVGEGEHAPAINGKNLTLQLINFLVLLGILVYFGGRAINKALLSRHEQLKAELASAETARTQAEARLRKHETRLAGLEREITAMRAGIKQEAEVEKQQLIAAAEERARRVREETVFAIEQQVKEAHIALRRDVAQTALRVAEEILRRTVDANDQRRFLESFMNEVAGSGVDVPGAVGKAV
jgi:F-type H+-transporting ATPase subunit b